MARRLNPTAFAAAAALVAAFGMLLLGVLGVLGLYEGGVRAMEQWHVFFSITVGGVIAGMLEAAVVTFVFCYLFVAVYNTLDSTL